MIILYFVLHLILVAEENACRVLNTSENEFMSSEKQSTNSAVDENIFQTIKRSSFDTEATNISSQHSKKRTQTTFHKETTRLSDRPQSKKSRLS
jgi:hypothetical protein